MELASRPSLALSPVFAEYSLVRFRCSAEILTMLVSAIQSHRGSHICLRDSEKTSTLLSQSTRTWISSADYSDNREKSENGESRNCSPVQISPRFATDPPENYQAE